MAGFGTVLLALSAGSTAASASRKLVELAPSKAVMLIKVWQGRETNANVMTTVPDGRKLKVVRASAGEELTRRTRCKENFSSFLTCAFALAQADSSDYPQAKRRLIPTLEIAGSARGEHAKVFASAGAGAATLSLVETLEHQWSVLSLCVNPDERNLPSIVEAEQATLDALRELCADSGATLRMHAEVELSLAGSLRRLGLTPNDGSPWLRVEEVDEAYDVCPEPR